MHLRRSRTAPVRSRDRRRARRGGSWLPARPGTRSSWLPSWPFRYARRRSESTSASGRRALFAPAEDCARPFEIRGRVDAERHAVDDGRIEAHAGLERAQLLEFLALFERGRGQRHETGERRAAKGIKADVMIERPLAGRRRRAGEIKRAQPPRSNRGADEFHHVGVGAFLRPRDLGRQRGDVDRRVGERSDRGRDVGWRERGQIALHIEDERAAPLRAAPRGGAGPSRPAKGRAAPERGSPRAPPAPPPAFSTQAATTSESVATTTSPSRAACARRSTWTIIGSPARSRSGLPGSLVE